MEDEWVVLEPKPLSPPVSPQQLGAQYPIHVPTVVPSALSTEEFYPAIDLSVAPLISNFTPEVTRVSGDVLMQASAPPFNLYTPPQHYIRFANFRINSDNARGIFRNWRDERWFAPADFQNLKEGQLYAFLVPYYKFSALVNTNYSGKIGHSNTTLTTTTWSSHSNHWNHSHRNHQRQNLRESTTLSWKSASGSRTGDYTDLLVCASIVDEDARLLAAVGNWDLSQVVSTLSYQNMLGPSKDWRTCWGKAHDTIVDRETEKATEHLINDNCADTTANVKVSIQVCHLQYELIYFPVYYYGYTFEGKEYKFFMNGQTGVHSGERPYGLGVVGRGINTVTGAVTDLISTGVSALRGGPVADRKTIEEWKKLQREPENFNQ